VGVRTPAKALRNGLLVLLLLALVAASDTPQLTEARVVELIRGRFHLDDFSKEKWAGLTEGGDTDLHHHDSRYALQSGTGDLVLTEQQAPGRIPTGYAKIWLSDGRGAQGDRGDLMVSICIDGDIKYATLADYSDL